MKRYALAAAAFAALLFTEAGFGQVRRELQAQPRFVPFPLIYVDTAEAAEKLTARLGKDSEVLTNKASNSVFVRASAEKIEKAKGILQRFDVKLEFCIIPLKHLDATKAAKAVSVILTLIAILSDDRESYVAADEKANRIVISATDDRIRHVRAILALLDANYMN